MRPPLVEILYFDGCPNHHPAIALVEHVGRELGLVPEIRLVNVADQAAAERLRFLGSPTIRVAGLDVDPNTEKRTDYALACRVFRTEAGTSALPEERWVRDALLREPLHAAGISPDRRGTARTRRLSPAQRTLYVWILREFAAARPPSAAATRGAAAELRLDSEEALAVLAREDLVHADDGGCPVIAYPFSAEPRGHRVLVDRDRWVEAMCALDALGIAPMLGVPVEIHSRDPLSGGEIRVRLDPAGAASWEPEQAVVLAGSGCSEGPSFCGCCDVLNFFDTRESAEGYLAGHPDVGGRPISVPEAIEAGRAVFGDVLGEL